MTAAALAAIARGAEALKHSPACCPDPAPHHISPRASPAKSISASAHSFVHAGGSLSGGYAAASEHAAAMHRAAAGEPSPGFAHIGAAVKVHPSSATQDPVAQPPAAHASSHASAIGVAAGAIPQRR